MESEKTTENVQAVGNPYQTIAEVPAVHVPDKRTHDNFEFS